MGLKMGPLPPLFSVPAQMSPPPPPPLMSIGPIPSIPPLHFSSSIVSSECSNEPKKIRMDISSVDAINQCIGIAKMSTSFTSKTVIQLLEALLEKQKTIENLQKLREETKTNSRIIDIE